MARRPKDKPPTHDMPSSQQCPRCHVQLRITVRVSNNAVTATHCPQCKRGTIVADITAQHKHITNLLNVSAKTEKQIADRESKINAARARLHLLTHPFEA